MSAFLSSTFRGLRLAVSQPNIRYAHYHTVYVARLGDTNERIPEGVAFRTAYEAGEV